MGDHSTVDFDFGESSSVENEISQLEELGLNRKYTAY